MPTRAEYDDAVRRLRAQYAALPADAPVRLGKATSNLFRLRSSGGPRLDVGFFSGVLAVDPIARTADVLGMTTYEDLVDATLPLGFMPLVVPQLKSITLGGAVTGLGVESSSFRNGLPHESVLEMDILTGDGEVVTASPDNEHAELYRGFPNSYGSLGYALRLRIELEPVQPYVALEHRRFADHASFTAGLAAAVDEPGVDFVDGTAFSPQELYVTIGRFTDEATQEPSDYTLTGIYYRSLQQRRRDLLTTRDYLWRWDTDWFWCSRAFGAQHTWVRRLLGRDRLRSTTWWKLVDLEQRYRFKARIDKRRGLPEREMVVQDVEVEVARLPELLAFLDDRTEIRPVWACPIRTRGEHEWPLYPLEPGKLWVNVGFWSTVALPAGQGDGYHNRAIEEELVRLGGRKSLYSTAFYPEDEFWSLYGGDAYQRLRKTYDPDSRLLDLYAKTVGRH